MLACNLYEFRRKHRDESRCRRPRARATSADSVLVFVGLVGSFQGEIHVESDRRNPNRSAIPVVSGIGNMLEIEGREESREEPCAVIRLRYTL